MPINRHHPGCCGCTEIDIEADTCAYYRMDESSGDALDETVNGYDLTENGTVGTNSSGLINSARIADTSDFFERASAESCFCSQAGSTVWGWFNHNGADFPLSSGSDIIVQKVETGFSMEYNVFITRDAPFFPGSTGRGVVLGFESGGSVIFVLDTTDPNIASGNWIFVAIWRTGGTWFLRVNSTVVSISGGVSTCRSTEFRIGGNSIQDSDADFDEWGVVDRVLTTGELDFLYNNGTGVQLL